MQQNKGDEGGISLHKGWTDNMCKHCHWFVLTKYSSGSTRWIIISEHVSIGNPGNRGGSDRPNLCIGLGVVKRTSSMSKSITFG